MAFASKADAAATVPANQVTDFQWKGNASLVGLGGGLAEVGDLNGDGLDDYAANLGRPTSRGIWILYGPYKRAAAVDLSNLLPTQGYRLRATSNSVSAPIAIGDQNGDGLDDILFESRDIVYSVSDPATQLPFCDGVGTSPTRCMDLSNLTNLAGDRMGFNLSHPSGMGSLKPGDFDGDGDAEIGVAYGSGAAARLAIIENGIGSQCPAMPAPCSIDISTLSAPDLIEFTPPTGLPFQGSLGGLQYAVVGDMNGDGKDDIAVQTTTDGATPPAVNVVYGKDWQTSPVQVGGDDSAGYAIPGAFSSAVLVPMTVGDVNGDGRPDIGIASASLLAPPTFQMWTGGKPTGGETLPNMPSDYGYRYEAAAEDGWLIDGNQALVPAGDLNGDGADDLAVGLSDTSIGGDDGTGQVTILLGQTGTLDQPIVLGADIDAAYAMTITGSVAGGSFGSAIASAGDQNDDGLQDLYVGSRTTDGTRGDVRLILSSSLLGSATTGLAGSVTDDAAELSGTAKANGRESTAYFEYGTSKSYGSTTDEQAIGSKNKAVFVEDQINGLEPNTEYHYRTVIKNDVGILAYGPDRTFTTNKVPDPPQTQCDIDPTKPGCDKYCEANPTAIGCVDPKAGLGSLIASTNAAKVKRGKKATITASVTSTGSKDAEGTKICLKGPAALIKGAKCQTVGNLQPGATATKKFKVTVKKKAKKGKAATLTLTASGTGLETKTAKVKIRVK